MAVPAAANLRGASLLTPLAPLLPCLCRELSDKEHQRQRVESLPHDFAEGGYVKILGDGLGFEARQQSLDLVAPVEVAPDVHDAQRHDLMVGSFVPSFGAAVT